MQAGFHNGAAGPHNPAEIAQLRFEAEGVEAIQLVRSRGSGSTSAATAAALSTLCSCNGTLMLNWTAGLNRIKTQGEPQGSS